MARYKYHPDYYSIYPEDKMKPGESLTADVLAVLRESDRKMKYLEYDIKSEQFQTDPKTGERTPLPSREDSLDRLQDLQVQFRSEEQSVEDEVVRSVLIYKMRRCLERLSEDEQDLLYALFFADDGCGMTERNYAQISGIPQKTINDRRHRILAKLKKMIET